MKIQMIIITVLLLGTEGNEYLGSSDQLEKPVSPGAIGRSVDDTRNGLVQRPNRLARYRESLATGGAAVGTSPVSSMHYYPSILTIMVSWYHGTHDKADDLFGGREIYHTLSIIIPRHES